VPHRRDVRKENAGMLFPTLSNISSLQD
jgi:hypothetical protein